MGFIWFWIVAVMLAAYVVLDGFDLGVGILHPLLARSESDRQIMLRSIGPVWDGNEVWLLAGGGTLYFAFPALYAAAFSGFYLALMIVLWLLICAAPASSCACTSTTASGGLSLTACSFSPARFWPCSSARPWPM